MDLVRLVYHSRIQLDGELRPPADQITDILTVSAENNQRDGVTGGLIHDAKWFVQIVEGTEGEVSRTFERILCDPRHSDIALVKMQPTPTRRFGQWWMAGASWGAANAHLFHRFCEEATFDPHVMSSDHLVELVDAVLRHAAQGQPRAGWMHRCITRAA